MISFAKRMVSMALVSAMTLICACGSRVSDKLNADQYVSITYLTIGDRPQNGKTEQVIEKLNKILEKKASAKLDIAYVSWDTYKKDYKTAISDDGVNADLIGTSTDWLGAWEMIANGYFMPISEEMFKTNCPKTYESMSKEDLDLALHDGVMYMIPEDGYTQWTNHGFIYRGDYAASAGIDRISSWEDMTEYFKYVYRFYPDMIPWDADRSNFETSVGYFQSKSDYIPLSEVGLYGLWGVDRKDQNKIISPFYEGNLLLEYAKLMKEWKKYGVWRKSEVSSDKEGEFVSGVSSVYERHTEEYFTKIRYKMQSMQPGSDPQFFWFGQERDNLTKNSIFHGAMAVNASSENPEKALQVYDLLRNDPECYMLITRGIEGEQYILDENGEISKPRGYNENKDGIVTDFWWGRNDSLEPVNGEYAYDDCQELFDTYQEKATEYPFDGYDFSKEIDYRSVARMNDICDKYLSEICYGNYEISPEEEIALFRNELKNAGIEYVTIQIQQVIDAGRD